MKRLTLLYRSGENAILGDGDGHAFACALREAVKVQDTSVDLPTAPPQRPPIRIGGLEVPAPQGPWDRVEWRAVDLQPHTFPELPGVEVQAGFDAETATWFVKER